MASGNLMSTQHLVEFLAFVSSAADQATAARNAAEGAAQLLEAELAAVVVGEEVLTTVGFPRGRSPDEEIAQAVTMLRSSIFVPGLGECMTVVGRVASTPPVSLLVARLPGEGFSAEEANLVRGMGRVLDLTMGMMRTLQAERQLHERSRRQAVENAELLKSLQDRQRLLEQLSLIQRAISRHEPFPSICETIVAAARELIGGSVVSLHLSDAGNPDHSFVASSAGLERDGPSSVPHAPLATDAVDRTISSNGVGHVRPVGRSEVLGLDLERRVPVVVAPVHEGMSTVGALSLEAEGERGDFDAEDEAMLVVLADHVSLALSDARTLELMRLARQDSLTGLASRPLFLEKLQHCLTEVVGRRGEVAVLFIDLDRFKLINDTLGHSSGDHLLIEVGRRIARGLRTSDVAARLGGDEFAVVVSGDNCLLRATSVAGRLISDLSSPYSIEGHQLYASASIGIAVSDGADEADDLMRKADVAMYRAKQDGRGRYRVFEPAMRAQFSQRVQLESELRGVLDVGDLRLHYQPLVDLASAEIVGAEALLRWPQPRRGMVPPLEFIPIAEEAGMMPAIGRWVLHEACREAARWGRAGAPISLSVNVSAGQVQQGTVADDVAAALLDSGLRPDLLTLELTESSRLLDDEATRYRLERLKDLGVKLAMDDFGTGYSSLSYMRTFPLDILKIDRSLIRDLGRDPRASDLARSIVHLGHSMGLEVVAEGIEQRVEADILLSAGCEFGQGYYFARPQAASALRQLLGTSCRVIVAASTSTGRPVN